ncbi:polar amino acid transport system permease protein [Microbacterium sp. W4I4]|uniref:amino acid ABC transporter permease n=1 Tax=Microbacterium sp. W4I4 TaxID=3042295 RepID=UPI00277FD19C|nr:amino acid ABC transporter permease [Microbacterium sp. W4I4]MDQ0613085.1 polar amino acid transport system permease protein [Microbacterium sp. W4I4]
MAAILTRTQKFIIANGREIPVIRRVHWVRWLGGAVAAVCFALFIVSLATNENIRWNRVLDYLFDGKILDGLVVTIWVSILATVLGLVLGVVLAVMKLSHNPVFNWLSTIYIWFFRSTPVLVQLIFWYNLAFLFPRIILQIPFTGIGVFWDTNEVMTGFNAALLGLGLNLAAYFAETVRAGIQAVDRGQTEAAAATGMTSFQQTRIIVLPQALRIIIPPTANEFISMLKTTSLIYVVAGNDLMTNASQIYKQNNLIMELLIVASIWYMVLTAVATFLQTKLEQRFGVDAVRVVRGASWTQRAMGAMRANSVISPERKAAQR